MELVPSEELITDEIRHLQKKRLTYICGTLQLPMLFILCYFSLSIHQSKAWDLKNLIQAMKKTPTISISNLDTWI